MTRVSVAIAFALSFATAAQARPRLAVLVVFDQLRAVELERYAPFFGPGGFGGLADNGARFDAYYQYACTETGPGHATLATGANPRVHGIAVNTWYVGTEKHYAVDDPRYPVIGASDKSGRSAFNLAVPTLGDAMKADSHGRAKVVTVSLKDRAAILTGGRTADLAVWYEPQQARFTTSTAYVAELPPWLEERGAALPAASFEATWTPLPVPEPLAALAPPDDRPGEGAFEGWGKTFPHDLKDQPEPLAHKLYRMTPNGMSDVFTLALDAVDQLQMGKDLEPDLLVVSISTTDYLGHNYGPDSLEVLDVLRRADVLLRRFVAGLESRVGRRDFVIAVTADHGSMPPPLTLDPRLAGGTLAISEVEAAVERGVKQALPKDQKKRLLMFNIPQLFVDTSDLAPADAQRVLAGVRTSVAAVPGVAHVYDMGDGDNREDPFSPFMVESAFPGRHAQLFVRQKARVVVLEKPDSPGTDHGSPYVYDRRVPLLLYGPGVEKGRFAAPVDPRDVAPTLAFLLGVPPPDACQGRPLPAVER